MKTTVGPDGTRIALWISIKDNKTSSSTSVYDLAVLDILANKTIHYCISGFSSLQFEEVFERYTTTANLIWSPDSNQILFARNKEKSRGTENVIVDLANNTVYKVIEDTEPIGWMTNAQ